MAAGDIIAGFSGPFKSIGSLIHGAGLAAMIIIPVVLICGGFLWFFIIGPKRFNMTVIFNMTRSDGKIVYTEIGKGIYNPKKGVLSLKRPKTGGLIKMKLPDPKKYIYGDRTMQVSQIGPNNWVAIHPDSLTQYVDEKGVVEYFIDYKADITDQLSWSEGYKRLAKATFSIQSFLQQYQTVLAIGFVIIAQAISTAFIIYSIRK